MDIELVFNIHVLNILMLQYIFLETYVLEIYIGYTATLKHIKYELCNKVCVTPIINIQVGFRGGRLN